MYRSAKNYYWITIFRYIFLLFFIFFPNSPYAKPPTLELNEDKDTQSLNGYVEALFDYSSNLTLDKVEENNDWREVGDQPFSKGLGLEVVWLRFTIANQDDAPLTRFFQCNNIQADQITVWIRRPNGKRTKYNTTQCVRRFKRSLRKF